ncbi:hypothetical protein NVSP9465_01312 [Novosphingobium sp. CECT 9465]|nr:hypothetical protein NVSP9465_01312 [Novosphingobium sp. CECT 9465]
MPNPEISFPARFTPVNAVAFANPDGSTERLWGWNLSGDERRFGVHHHIRTTERWFGLGEFASGSGIQRDSFGRHHFNSNRDVCVYQQCSTSAGAGFHLRQRHGGCHACAETPPA